MFKLKVSLFEILKSRIAHALYVFSVHFPGDLVSGGHRRGAKQFSVRYLEGGHQKMWDGVLSHAGVFQRS